tara:strand:+ start:132 stop:353 length:222 start_codon:yes stop_codon:yes gene_type:complete
MNTINLENNGLMYTINRDKSESLDVFHKRSWYIVKKNPSTAKDLDKIIQYSFIWRNIEIYGLKYSEKIKNLVY